MPDSHESASEPAADNVVRISGGRCCTAEQVALWRSGALVDVTVRVQGIAFKAHKFVLAGGSGYFRGVLTSGMRDGGDELDLSETSAVCFSHVTAWLYSGVCTLSDESMLSELLETASFLQIPELVQATAAQLANRITIKNIATAWNLGELFYEPSLVEAARRVAVKEFESFAAGEAFLQFDADRLGQILADDYLKAPETVVFESVVRFLTESPTGPVDDFKAMTLFGHVRFALLPLEFIKQRVEQEPLLINCSWGGWVVVRAFRDAIYHKDTILPRNMARKGHVGGSTPEWDDLRVGMQVRMLEDESAVLAMFDTGVKAPGAAKSIGLGTLRSYLKPLLGKTYQIIELWGEKRGIRIADGSARWLLPYTAFVVDT